MVGAFCILFKKSFPVPRLCKYSSVFMLKAVSVAFLIYVFNPPVIGFCVWYKVGVRVFAPYEYPIFSALYIRKSIMFSLQIYPYIYNANISSVYMYMSSLLGSVDLFVYMYQYHIVLIVLAPPLKVIWLLFL